jgi:glutaredoxin-like protein NrdH
MTFTQVPGKNSTHDVTLYALSTCGWCRRTKELLDSLNVQYRYIYVDQTSGDERTEAMARVRELNPRGSYPTMEVDGEAIAGYDEIRVNELLGT